MLSCFFVVVSLGVVKVLRSCAATVAACILFLFSALALVVVVETASFFSCHNVYVGYNGKPARNRGSRDH